MHGEQHNMMRLKSKLLSLNATKVDKVKVFSPRNCEELKIPFKTDKLAKVVGKLASIPPPQQMPTPDDQEPELVSGVIVQNDFKMSLMDPEDLREYAGLTTSTIACRQRFTLSAAGLDLIKWALEGTFGSIEELPESKKKQDQNGEAAADGDAKKEGVEEEVADEEISQLVAAFLVMGCVTVRYRNNGEVELEWEGNMLNDGIADAVMAVLLSTESSPAAVKRKCWLCPLMLQQGKEMMVTNRDLLRHTESSSKHTHTHQLPTRNLHANTTPEDRLDRLFMFLEAQFGKDNVSPVELPKLAPAADSNGAATPPKSIKAEGDNNNDEGDAEESGDADAEMEDKDDGEEKLAKRQKAELDRLHKLGIPVPGVAIKVDKMSAVVWLEDLEVECAQKVFADRVKAVVERAVEVTAPLWA